jgi:PAS domain S-box-containing protein
MGNDDVDTAATLKSGEHSAANLTRPRAMIWTFGPDGKCRMVNKRWLEYRGVTIEQERGDGWIQGLHPDDRQPSLNSFRAAFTSRRVFQLQFRVQRADGAYAWLRSRGVPHYLNDGKFLGYSAEINEIDGPAVSTPDWQNARDSSSGARGPLEQIAERCTKNAFTKSCDGPTDQTQAISAEAFEHWLVESDSPLLVLDASGAVIFRNPAAANLLAAQAPSTESLSFGGLSGKRNECKTSNDKTATADLRALADSRWIVQLHNIRMTDEPQGGGFIVFSPEGASAARAHVPPDGGFIHDLLNMAMGIQVIADLLEAEGTSREEWQEYAKLLSRSACQLLSEVERQRSLFDQPGTNRAQARADGL